MTGVSDALVERGYDPAIPHPGGPAPHWLGNDEIIRPIIDGAEIWSRCVSAHAWGAEAFSFRLRADHPHYVSEQGK